MIEYLIIKIIVKKYYIIRNIAKDIVERIKTIICSGVSCFTLIKLQLLYSTNIINTLKYKVHMLNPK